MAPSTPERETTSTTPPGPPPVASKSGRLQKPSSKVLETQRMLGTAPTTQRNLRASVPRPESPSTDQSNLVSAPNLKGTIPTEWQHLAKLIESTYGKVAAVELALVQVTKERNEEEDANKQLQTQVESLLVSVQEERERNRALSEETRRLAEQQSVETKKLQEEIATLKAEIGRVTSNPPSWAAVAANAPSPQARSEPSVPGITISPPDTWLTVPSTSTSSRNSPPSTPTNVSSRSVSSGSSASQKALQNLHPTIEIDLADTELAVVRLVDILFSAHFPYRVP